MSGSDVERLDVSSVLNVARKDYLDAIRSRALWALTAVFVFFSAGLAFLLVNSNLLGVFYPAFLQLGFGSTFGDLSATDFVGFFTGPATLFVPIVALVVTHKAIAGEIESGSAKFLLSVPISRREAVVGKVAGRTGVLWTALAIGFLGAVLVLYLDSGTGNLKAYAIGLGLTFLFGITYTAIGVSVSALADTASRAITYAVAAFAVIAIGLGFAANGLYRLFNDTFFPPPLYMSGPSPPEAPAWFFFLKRLSPSSAYRASIFNYVGGETPAWMANFPNGAPFYLSDWFSIVIMLFWIVAPVLIGFKVFEGSDIG